MQVDWRLSNLAALKCILPSDRTELEHASIQLPELDAGNVQRRGDQQRKRLRDGDLIVWTVYDFRLNEVECIVLEMNAIRRNGWDSGSRPLMGNFYGDRDG